MNSETKGEMNVNKEHVEEKEYEEDDELMVDCSEEEGEVDEEAETKDNGRASEENSIGLGIRPDRRRQVSAQNDKFQDWECEKCGYTNFEYRITCKKCLLKRLNPNNNGNNFLNRKRKMSNNMGSMSLGGNQNFNPNANPRLDQLRQFLKLSQPQLAHFAGPSTREQMEIIDSLVRIFLTFNKLRVPIDQQFKFFLTFMSYLHKS